MILILIFFFVSIDLISRVDFMKWPCRQVDFKDPEPQFAHPSFLQYQK